VRKHATHVLRSLVFGKAPNPKSL